MVEPAAQAQRAVGQLVREWALARGYPIERAQEGAIRELARTRRAQGIERRTAGGGDRGGRLQSSMPLVGDDGTATSRRGMRPAR